MRTPHGCAALRDQHLPNLGQGHGSFWHGPFILGANIRSKIRSAHIRLVRKLHERPRELGDVL